VKARVLVGAVLGTHLLACGAGPHTRAAGAVTPLEVSRVAWNPTSAPVGHVRCVAEVGDVVTVFADKGATVFQARTPVAADLAARDWIDAATVAGAEGGTTWTVGVARDGRVYRLRALSSFEDVTARFGLGGAGVRGVAALGEGSVGFLLGSEIAVAGAGRVTRYAPADGVTFDALAGGAGIGAAVAPSGLRVFDVAHQRVTAYPLEGIARAAVDARGRVYAATKRAVYTVDSAGRLALVYDAEGDSIHGLVASGDAVWFADGQALGLVGDDHVAETESATIAKDASLAPSPGGDVWVFAGDALSRFSRAGAARALAEPASWDADIAPVFARACSACHLADGESGTDLSTPKAWDDERAEITERVVEKRTMPPAGHALSDADRDAIRRYLTGTSPAPTAPPSSTGSK
jgi:mono/diheme cytochrome c family protein